MKKKYRYIILTILLSIIPVLAFYFAYYLKLEKNSYDFERHFINPMKRMYRLDVKFKDLYFAGKAGDSIYLGNHGSTGHLIRTDSLLTKHEPWVVKMYLDDFVKDKGQYIAMISDTALYLTNGAAKAILKGRFNERSVAPYALATPYFQEFVPISSSSVVFRYVSGRTNVNSLRKQSTTGTRIENDRVLEKQVDGLFCTSGMLHYNPEINKLIYIYHYRNEVLVLDTNLNLVKKIKTIDPIDTARFTTAVIESDRSRVSTSPSLLVNAYSGVWKNLLFVESKLMGKNEDDLKFKKSLVIDVYDLKKYRYLYSFYLPRQDKMAVGDFTVYDGDIYTLSNHFMNRYKLELIKSQKNILVHNESGKAENL